jgi:hypothetical protein
MKHTSALGLGFAMLAALAIAVDGSAARANSIPDGTGFVQCTTKTGLITDPVSCDGGTDSGLVTYAPFAGVSGSAFGEGLVDEAGVFGVLNYSFEVTGGNPGDVVPVDIETTLSAIPRSIGHVFSEIIVSADTSSSVTICNLQCTDEAIGFTGILQVDALSGAVYTNAIHLEIEAIGALGGTSDFNGGSASADPYVFIPAPFASQYTVEVSPNIGNALAATVPEPGAWAMLLVGFATLAGLRRRGVRGLGNRS